MEISKKTLISIKCIAKSVVKEKCLLLDCVVNIKMKLSNNDINIQASYEYKLCNVCLDPLLF